MIKENARAGEMFSGVNFIGSEAASASASSPGEGLRAVRDCGGAGRDVLEDE